MNTHHHSAITRIQKFKGGWMAKRDDEGAFAGPDYPSGSKWRQFLAMAEQNPGADMIVGCSANSAMQTYVAAASKLTAVIGIVYVPKRKTNTEATAYALHMGARVEYVSPGYLSMCRSAARRKAKTLGKFVAWNPRLAFADIVAQCINIPTNAKRIVVPCGSGLTAAAILVGLSAMKRRIIVVAVAVSPMTTHHRIGELITKYKMDHGVFGITASLRLIPPTTAYDQWAAAKLPDGSILDPYYAAKALPYVVRGDCLWIPGVRPKAAIPKKCIEELSTRRLSKAL